MGNLEGVDRTVRIRVQDNSHSSNLPVKILVAMEAVARGVSGMAVEVLAVTGMAVGAHETERGDIIRARHIGYLGGEENPLTRGKVQRGDRVKLVVDPPHRRKHRHW